ncbi:MAG: type II secretion system F family protein [Nitrospinota bacterium]
MPVFMYRALDSRGQTHEDEVVAESSSAAREVIRQKGLYPIEVSDFIQARKFGSPLSYLKISRGFSAPSLAAFTRHLATLLSAGLQVVPAMSILVRQSRDETSRRLFIQIRENVNEGMPLEKAMKEHPKVFSELYVSLVRAGEASGALDKILSRLADYLELQQNLRRRLTGALAYPALMVMTGMSVLIFMMTFVVPRVVKIFSRAQQDLPWPTQVLIKGSYALSHYAELWILALVAIAVIFFVWNRTEKGRWTVEGAKLKIPFYGGLILKRAIARFGRTLGELLAAGVPILDALTISKLVIGNRVLEHWVDRAREETHKGGALGASLERSGYFPPVFTDMIGVGEQTGRLDDMLIKVSAHLEEESESTIQTMMSLVDPVLILVMGVAVGFVVLAVLLPLFEISQLIR